MIVYICVDVIRCWFACVSSNGTLHLDDVSDSPQSVLKPPVVPMPAEEPKAEPEDMDEPVDMTYDPKPVTPIKAAEEPEPEPEPQGTSGVHRPYPKHR